MLTHAEPTQNAVSQQLYEIINAILLLISNIISVPELLRGRMSKMVNFPLSFLCIKAHYACLRLRLQSGFVLMRKLIVAAPCVCRRRCSRRYSTAACHRCLFQFHLAALVIKSWTDTTHQIMTVITSERHCVHKSISLGETASPAPCFCPPCSLFLS